MNPERKINAIDRGNNKWKQNQSSGGTNVAQKVPECPTNDENCETPLLTPLQGSAPTLDGRTASGQAPFGLPTSTRSVHPILGLHELMSSRDEHLAVVQADMLESARLIAVLNNLTGEQKPVAPFWSLAKCRLEASSGWARSGRGWSNSRLPLTRSDSDQSQQSGQWLHLTT